MNCVTLKLRNSKDVNGSVGGRCCSSLCPVGPQGGKRHSLPPGDRQGEPDLALCYFKPVRIEQSYFNLTLLILLVLPSLNFGEKDGESVFSYKRPFWSILLIIAFLIFRLCSHGPLMDGLNEMWSPLKV